MEKLANLGKSVSSKSVSSSKSTKGSEGTSSAKWDDYTNRVFIQLCVDEIGKGNRPNSHFNSNGWNNLLRRFNEITGRSLVYKQIRNHWDAMKKEWLLFKNLMNSETGIGWNPLKKSIDASEEWWSRKIKDNVEYKKFKNKDLSFIWFEYDQLFCDVAATGERARAPSQRSGYDIENEQLEVDDETNEVEEHDQVGDSDDIGSSRMLEKDAGLESLETSSMAEKVMFPSLDSIKRKYCGEGGKRKKVSGAASLKEDIHSLLQVMENKNSASTPSIEITIKDAMEILNNVPGVAPMSELWNYACNLLSKKDMREVFVSQPSHEARLSWLEFNYDLFKRSK